jgi:peptidoglycan/LPS O-acetylase OafA/YrhL
MLATQTTDPKMKAERRYDLDWLRVIAILGVFLYHSGRFFTESGWHISNAESSQIAQVLKDLFDPWGMPLVFAVSGAGVALALRPDSAGKFLFDRAKRLLVPLAFGILVLAPPQLYLERLTHGEFQGSFWEYLPRYFGGPYGVGADFAWSGVHLWFLEYLFVYTLLWLPLFVALKRPAGQRLLAALGHISSRPGVIFLWMLPVALMLIAIDPFGMVGRGLSDDWERFLFCLPFPLVGFLIFSDSRIQLAIVHQRRAALVVTFVMIAALFVLRTVTGLGSTLVSYVLIMLLASLYAWSAILTILGYGMRYLNANHRWLPEANTAVLPFYILHQPVILMIGYVVIPWSLPILVKYLIIAPLALVVALVLYEFGIRRIRPVRFLFGMKQASAATEAKPALSTQGV